MYASNMSALSITMEAVNHQNLTFLDKIFVIILLILHILLTLIDCQNFHVISLLELDQSFIFALHSYQGQKIAI